MRRAKVRLGHKACRVIRVIKGIPVLLVLLGQVERRPIPARQVIPDQQGLLGHQALRQIQVRLDLQERALLQAQPGLLARHSLAQQDQLVLPRPLAGMRV